MICSKPSRARLFGAALALALMAAAGAVAADAAAADTAAAEPAAPAQGEVRALFAAFTAAGRQLVWTTDGTRAGTQPLRLGPNLGVFENFTDLGDGRVAFSAWQTRLGLRGAGYVTDGTREGTNLLAAGAWGYVGFNVPTGFTPLGDGRFVFTFPALNRERTGGVQALWISDGTRAGTGPFYRWPQQTGTFHATNFARLRDGEILFAMDDGRGRHGLELWFTDGTRDGTRLVRNLTGDALGSGPRDLVQLADGLVLFKAFVGGWQLWVSDGTRAGTLQLTSGGLPGQGLFVTEVAPVGDGQALFALDDLWRTDGTVAGTGMVFDPTDPRRPCNTQALTPLGDGQVLFVASVNNYWRLMVTDGTREGTGIVRQIDWLTTVTMRSLGDGRAVFWHWQPDLGHYALWVTDGTRQGTGLVQRFPTMDNSVLTHRLQERTTSLGDGRALFAYDNGRTGIEPWVTDGTRAGTGVLRNINRGGDSNPTGFTPFVPAAD